jgi:predicted enzyme related to lactoylglutathione lyase
MPQRISLTGAPCWIDLFTSDQAGARTFYGELFGWTSADPNPEFGGYLNFSKDGGLVAGCMQAEPGMGVPDVWSVYLQVDDSEAVAKSVEAHGGRVMVSPMAVGDLGTMAVFVDPAGAAIGTWEPGTHKGIATLDEPGTPSWFELHTKGHAAAIAFYQDVFGWTTKSEGDTDEFRYSTAVDGDRQVAGVMDASSFLPDEAPSYWTVYLQVDDVDATLAKAVELGGSIIEPAVDTPYGRLATLGDHAGARIKLRTQPTA